MAQYEDGTTVTMHRKGNAYVVEAVNAAGVMIDSMDCDSLEQAQAVLDTPVNRW